MMLLSDRILPVLEAAFMKFRSLDFDQMIHIAKRETGEEFVVSATSLAMGRLEKAGKIESRPGSTGRIWIWNEKE